MPVGPASHGVPVVAHSPPASARATSASRAAATPWSPASPSRRVGGGRRAARSTGASVRTALVAETEAGLTLLILDALRAGVEGQRALAAHLKCPIPDIRSAYKRIKRRLLALRE